MPGRRSPFSEQERIWIVKKFGELKSATLVRRAFHIEFSKTNPKSIPKQNQFDRVLRKFEDSGDVGDPQVKRKLSESVPPDHVKAVADFFARNKQGHARGQGHNMNHVFKIKSSTMDFSSSIVEGFIMKT